ncbi:MAG: hypothetical protein O7G30_03855 [Proteobacteria bacterium]|nr:hypothetical protein [Pseudomonadota bacterium]
MSDPLQVGRLLGEAGLRVQTVNTSVAGFAAENVLALLESEVVKFEGDFLFVLIGWNNIGQYGPDGLAYKRQRAGYEISPVQKVLALYTSRGFATDSRVRSCSARLPVL